MSKPVIAVTADCKDIDPYIWHAAPANYIDAVHRVADGIPLIVPNLGDALELDAMLDRVDGLLLTGSRTNVHPSHYGTAANADHEPFDPSRDSTTIPMINRAIDLGIPVLAICRGIQELNVALGGTLTENFQKNRNIENHDYPFEGPMDERFALSHGLKIKPGSCLATILEKQIVDDSVDVNSLHTQALDQLGQRVVVEATSEDGTIEAISVADAPGFVVGVQWHPEYWAETDAASNAILRAFGDAARQYCARKRGLAVAAE